MRKKLFSIIEPDNAGNKLSAIYDIIMMVVVVMGVLPLTFKENHNILDLD